MFNRKFINTLSNTLLFSLLVSSLSMVPVQDTSAGTSINLDFTARTGKNGGGDSSPAYRRQSATDGSYVFLVN